MEGNDEPGMPKTGMVKRVGRKILNKMKRIFLSAMAGLIFYVNLFAQLHCGTYDDFDSLFNRVGAFHNTHLENIKINFSPHSSIGNKSAAIDYIKDFNKSYCNQHILEYFPAPPSTEQIDSLFEISKGFCDLDNFNACLFSQSSAWSLDNIKNQLNSSGLIDSANLNILEDLVNLIEDGYGGESSEQLENNLVVLANNWLTVNEGKYENGKELTGNIIALGLKSCEWWNQNTAIVIKQKNKIDNIKYSGPLYVHEIENMFFAFPWIADIAGAIVGAGLYTIIHGNNFKWENLGLATGTGAISSSGGFVKKVSNWIKNLF